MTWLRQGLMIRSQLHRRLVDSLKSLNRLGFAVIYLDKPGFVNRNCQARFCLWHCGRFRGGVLARVVIILSESLNDIEFARDIASILVPAGLTNGYCL